MLRFALRNLVRNRARTTLALLGLAASTAGVVLLVSLSFGARRMVGEAMDLAKGVIVLKKHAPEASLEPTPLLVFLNPRAELDLDQSPVTALHVKQLKEHIRRQPKAEGLALSSFPTLEQKLGLAAAAE